MKKSIFEFFINYEKTALQNFFLLCKDVLWFFYSEIQFNLPCFWEKESACFFFTTFELDYNKLKLNIMNLNYGYVTRW